ncbi:MAG: ABC transporter ATP-binding protein, partial [Patescibacteria group bacterium]
MALMQSEDAVIIVKNLVKDFNGVKAVAGISFTVKAGEVLGLLGPNGAGKTTTIRILTGIIKPSFGSVSISNFDIEKEPIKAKQLLGIVPEMANAYMDLSAWQNLMLMGELYGIGKEKRREKANELLTLFKLFEHKNKKVKFFSKGMKQRLIIAMALMNDTKILFLDEPTSG